MIDVAVSEMKEAREIYNRAMKLSPTLREEIAIELFESINHHPGRPYSDRDYWKEEIARRVEAIRNGTMKTYTIDETMEYLDKVVREERSS